MNPLTRKMLWVSLGEAITKVERMIEMAVDRETRNKLVARLASFDQRLAMWRDRREERQ
jgi:hypothetical protein